MSNPVVNSIQNAIFPTDYRKLIALTVANADAGVPKVLSTTSIKFQKAVIRGNVSARVANTGTVYLGLVVTNDTQEYAITTGAVITIEAPIGTHFDLKDFYLDVVTANDAVMILYS